MRVSVPPRSHTAFPELLLYHLMMSPELVTRLLQMLLRTDLIVLIDALECMRDRIRLFCYDELTILGSTSVWISYFGLRAANNVLHEIEDTNIKMKFSKPLLIR